MAVIRTAAFYGTRPTDLNRGVPALRGRTMEFVNELDQIAVCYPFWGTRPEDLNQGVPALRMRSADGASAETPPRVMTHGAYFDTRGVLRWRTGARCSCNDYIVPCFIELTMPCTMPRSDIDGIVDVPLVQVPGRVEPAIPAVLQILSCSIGPEFTEVRYGCKPPCLPSDLGNRIELMIRFDNATRSLRSVQLSPIAIYAAVLISTVCLKEFEPGAIYTRGAFGSHGDLTLDGDGRLDFGPTGCVTIRSSLGGGFIPYGHAVGEAQICEHSGPATECAVESASRCAYIYAPDLVPLCREPGAHFLRACDDDGNPPGV